MQNTYKAKDVIQFDMAIRYFNESVINSDPIKLELTIIGDYKRNILRFVSLEGISNMVVVDLIKVIQ